MRCSIFENLQDIKGYDFNDVIQSNACIGTEYIIHENKVIIKQPRTAFCLYNAEELLNEISKAGKYFGELQIKISLDINYNDLERIPFGLSENSFQIYYNEEQIKAATEYIKMWCTNYIPPCHTIEDNTLEANNIIELNAIEDFIGKCIVIYLIRTAYTSILHIQKNLYSENGYNEYEINKGIENLNVICPMLFKNYHKLDTLTFKYSRKDILNLLDHLDLIINQFCNLIMNWCNKFSNSLSATAIYNAEHREYFKLFVSDDITNLVWNHLISVITSKSPIQAKNVCSVCGIPLDIDFAKPGPKPPLCNKHHKEKYSSTTRDEEKRQLKYKLKTLLNNDILSDKQRTEIIELLKFSDRRFPKTRCNELLNELNHLK